MTWAGESNFTQCLWQIKSVCNTVIVARVATHCNALQRTATHCNTLQHTATHCSDKWQISTVCTQRFWQMKVVQEVQAKTEEKALRLGEVRGT